MAGELPAPRDRSIPVHFEPVTDTTVVAGAEIRGVRLTVNDKPNPTTIDHFSQRISVNNKDFSLNINGELRANITEQGFETETHHEDGGVSRLLVSQGKIIFEYNSQRQEQQEDIVKAEELTRTTREGQMHQGKLRGSISAVTGQVKEFRDAGLSNAAIAELLKVPQSIVEQTAHRLIKAGEIKALPRGRHVGDSINKLTQFIQEFQEAYPLGMITLSEMASHLKISRERARQLFEKLKSTYTSIPLLRGAVQKKFSEEYLTRLDHEVEKLMKGEQTPEQIADVLHTTMTTIRSSQKRILKPQKESAKLRKSELITQIKDLRNHGFGNKKIAEITKTTIVEITNTIQKLINTNQIQPMRRVKRQDELAPFDAKVKELCEEKLTYKEMAERIGQEVTVSHILGSLIRLRAGGEIELRPKFRHTKLFNIRGNE